ncbi:MAG TPA: hypothetical protein VH437_16110 [Terriglobales bacterium]|jgi:hypothetical protein
MRHYFPILLCLVACLLPGVAAAADLHPPAQVTAGSDFSIASDANGEGTFYLVGPANVSKRKVMVNGSIAVDGEEIEGAGRYTAILCVSGHCDSAAFFVQPDAPSRLSLLVHPSRVRVNAPNAISAAAFVFDKYRNMILAPQNVQFSATPREGNATTTTRSAENGVAWIRLTSASKEGPAKIGATIGKATEVRVVQQVASEACNLRIKANWISRQLWVETDPIRDCSGNAVPDGTVISFTKLDDSGKTTVDAPVKRGIARVQMPVQGNARISVASGVVTGNEIQMAGER